MDEAAHISQAFDRMGARVRIHQIERALAPIRIDVRRDRRGEFFDVQTRALDGLRVIDLAPSVRHLLLLVKVGDEKWKFLCGHDERAWFVAAIPESARGVTGVDAAREALKPAAVIEAERRTPLPAITCECTRRRLTRA